MFVKIISLKEFHLSLNFGSSNMLKNIILKER